jgi:hypothetical protein
MVRTRAWAMPDEPSNGANRFLTREVFRSLVDEGSFWGSGHLRTKNSIRRESPQRESLGQSNVVYSSRRAQSPRRDDISSSDLSSSDLSSFDLSSPGGRR